MRARSSVVCDSGGIARMYCEPPLSLRPTADALFVVGSAGGPIGGDDVALTITVEAGGDLHLRSAAAQVVLPGPTGEPSRFRVEASVDSGASLRMRLEPTVLARGCLHHSETVINLANDAALCLIETLVLGRHGEAAGAGTSRLRVLRGGQPLIHHELDLHPSSIGTARVVGLAAVVEPRWVTESVPPAARVSRAAWWLPADGPGGVLLALGSTVDDVESAIDAAPFASVRHVERNTP